MIEHIAVDPRTCNGKPVIKGTRIPVTVIIDQLAETGSIEGVLHKYPELNFEHVAAALHLISKHWSIAKSIKEF